MNVTASGEDPLRVVIVDDTEDLRELMRIALRRGGLHVVGEAGDGRAAIEVVGQARPDVVLLDLSMPVMDGMEALPHLRRLLPEGKIIVLSGFGASQMAERALKNGADGYLQKGLPLAQVLQRIREIALGSLEEEEEARPVRVLHAVPEPAATAWDALDLAPFGVLEVEATAPFVVVRLNPAAAKLLPQVPAVGRPLEEASSEVALLVAHHLTGGRASFATVVGQSAVEVTVRRSRQSLLLYLEAASDEVEKMRRTVATTAHEIRGPVAVLNALAETIAHDDIVDSAQRDRLMSSVARQARVLDGLTGDLLVTSQIARGVLRVDRRVVDPVAAAEAVIGDQQTPITLEVQDRRRVLADPLRFDQMIGNLLRNAVRYGEPPILVRIRPDSEDPDAVAIDVVDQGPGVPEDFEDRLFQEFARAADSMAGGIGLGLHVVRTLAEAHGGGASYAPGDAGGAVFTVTLPAAPVE